MSAPYPWLPMHLRRQRDPRLALAAKQLRKRVAELYGYIAFAMGTAAEHYQDGVFRPGTQAHTPAQVFDAAAGWGGRASLAEVLVAHGLLVVVEGGLMLEGWANEQGAQISKFERDRARKELARSEKKAQTVAGPAKDAPKTVPSASADRPQSIQGLEGEGERQGDREEAAADAARSEPVRPVPLPVTDVGGPEALVEAWRQAAEPTGRPTLKGPLSQRLRAKALARLREADVATWARVFELVCANSALWEPSTRGWVASFGWALSGGPALDSARAGTYGAWERPAAPPPPKACEACTSPSSGQVWGMELCEEHATQAVVSPEGARAWVEARRRGAA